MPRGITAGAARQVEHTNDNQPSGHLGEGNQWSATGDHKNKYGQITIP